MKGIPTCGQMQRLILANQPKHTQIHGKNTVVRGHAPHWAASDFDLIFRCFRKVCFQNEKTGTVERPVANILSVHRYIKRNGLPFVGVAADA